MSGINLELVDDVKSASKSDSNEENIEDILENDENLDEYDYENLANEGKKYSVMEKKELSGLIKVEDEQNLEKLNTVKDDKNSERLMSKPEKEESKFKSVKEELEVKLEESIRFTENSRQEAPEFFLKYGRQIKFVYLLNGQTLLFLFVIYIFAGRSMCLDRSTLVTTNLLYLVVSHSLFELLFRGLRSDSVPFKKTIFVLKSFIAALIPATLVFTVMNPIIEYHISVASLVYLTGWLVVQDNYAEINKLAAFVEHSGAVKRSGLFDVLLANTISGTIVLGASLLYPTYLTFGIVSSLIGVTTFGSNLLLNY